MIADKGDGAEARVLAPLRAAGQAAVIPPKSNRTALRDDDRDLHEARHLVENFFCTLKHHRAIATRYDKTARDFLAAIHLAATVILLNCGHALAIRVPVSQSTRVQVYHVRWQQPPKLRAYLYGRSDAATRISSSLDMTAVLPASRWMISPSRSRMSSCAKPSFQTR